MSRESWPVIVQLNAASLVDEGPGTVFDIIQEKAAPTGVMLAAHGFNGELVDRGRIWPGHGPKGSTGSLGGYFGTVHPEYYAGTKLGSPRVRETMFEGFDAMAVVAKETAARGLNLHVYVLESASTGGFQRHVTGWASVLEKDVDGRTGTLPCINHPDYRRWKIALLEDLYSSYQFKSLLWGVERWGPLHQALVGGNPACFCEHCRTVAVDHGLDWKRVVAGYIAFRDACRAGTTGPGLLRVLLANPEVLSWEGRWTRSYVAFHRDIYGAVKWLEPDRDFGLGLWHYFFIDPLLRAEWNMAEFADGSDYIRPILYHIPEGPRIKRYLGLLGKAIPGVKQETIWSLFTETLGLDLPSIASFERTGLPASYVAQGIDIVRRDSGGKARIIAGIGVDIFEHDLDHTMTPEDVEAAIRAAWTAKADGITISRNYGEMQHANLEAVGRTVAALRKG